MITYFISFLLLASLPDPVVENRTMAPDPCTVYGSVFIESNRRRADYIVYIESSEAFADLVVFKQDNNLLADDQGLWFFTEQEQFADFTIFIANDPSNVDFTIYYTDQIAYARCK